MAISKDTDLAALERLRQKAGKSQTSSWSLPAFAQTNNNTNNTTGKNPSTQSSGNKSTTQSTQQGSDPVALQNLRERAAQEEAKSSVFGVNDLYKKPLNLWNESSSRRNTQKVSYGTESKNAYASAKDKANSTTTITSKLSEKERKARIKEIKSELSELSKVRSGLSRASMYGNVGDMIAENEKKQEMLSKELKELERVGTFSASELKQFEIEDAKAEKARLMSEYPSYNPTARITPSQAEEYKEGLRVRAEADKKISSLEREKALYQKIEKFEELNSYTTEITSKKDFEQNSKYSPIKPKTDEELKAAGYKLDAEGKWYKNWGFGYRESYTGEDSDLYVYINDPSKRLSIDAEQASMGIDSIYKMNGYATMTEEEIGAYNYLYHQDRKNGTKKAEEYIKRISPMLENRAMELEAKRYSELSKESPVLMSGVSLVTNLENAMMYPAKLVATATGTYEDMPLLDTYGNRTQAIRGAVSEDMGTVGKFAYNATMSIGDMGVAMLAGGGNAKVIQAIMSSSAGSSAITDAKNNGASDGKALVIGLGSAAIEWATEKYSVEAILKKPESILGYIGTNALTEGTEEGVSNISNMALDAIVSEVFGERNEIEQMVDYLVLYEGKTEEEALNIAFNTKLQSLGEDVLLGGVTGFGMSSTVASPLIVQKGIDGIRNKFNKNTTQEENATSAEQPINEPDTLEKAAVDVVAKRNAAQVTENAPVLRETVAEDNSPAQTEAKPTASNNTRRTTTKGMSLAESLEYQSRNNEPITVEEVKEATGFGENGSKLVAEIANRDGVTFSQAERAVKVAYTAGFTDLNYAKADFATKVQKTAFDLGKLDRDIQNRENIAKAKNAAVYDGAFTKNEYSKKLSEPTRKMVATVAKHFGMSIEVVDKIIANTVDGKVYEANAKHTDGKMEISSTAEKLIHSLVLHESGHRMEQFATDEWNALANALYARAEKLGRRAKSGASQGMLFDAVKAQHDDAGLSLSTSGYIGEIAVRELETIFSSAEEFNSWVAEIHSNQQVKSAWNKFVEWLSEIIDDIKRVISQRNMTKEERVEANRQIAELERIKKLYADAYMATEKSVEQRRAEQKAETQGTTDTRSRENFDLKTTHITTDTSDDDRAKIISTKNINAPIYEGQADTVIENNLEKLNSDQIGTVKNALVAIGEQFGIFVEDIKIEDVDVEIRFSKSNLRESVSKKATPTEIAKLIPILKDAVRSAIGIEIHDNRYYYDTSTVYFENLLGGFVDGEHLIPVRFGLKHSKQGRATLYIVVDQNKIPIKSLEQIKKAEVVKATGPIKTEQITSRSVEYNISQIIPFVKSKDLLRYIPDAMLDNEQKVTKWEAVAETIKITADKNDKKYAEFIKKGNIRAARDMVVQAAKANGYTIFGYHGSHAFFTTFDKGNKTSSAPDGAYFFTDNKDVAYSYTSYKKNVDLNINNYPIYKQATPDGKIEENRVAHGGVYPVFIKMQSPYITDFEGKSWGNKVNGMDINETATWAKDNNYDGVVAKNIIDAGDLGDANYEVGLTRIPSTDYIIFDSARAKSAEVITYDENDNIIPISERFNDKDDDIRYSLKDSEGNNLTEGQQETDIDNIINQSMTMEQAKDMIQRAFVIGGIKEWFDGEYKNGDEWLRGEGADSVALVVENEWTLQQKFLDKVQGGLGEDFFVEDIIEAYEKGTLTGKAKQNVVKRLDTSKPTSATDTRVYAPKEIENAQEIYKVALERVTNSNRDKVNQARADIIMFAHNRGAAETLGITQSELNKKLATWARYTARAKEVSMRINKDVALFNKWTGIENSNLLNRATVSHAELDNLVNEVKGDSNGWQRSYIMRTMLALDTHIDYSKLNFEFVGTPKTSMGKSVNGLYDNSNLKITVKHNAPHTVAHEMGHFLDYQWARDLGCTGALTDGFGRGNVTDPDTNQFLANFDEFIEQIENVADLRSEYTMDRKEVFARFVAKFVQWVDLVANGQRSYGQEYLSYNDKFTASQYIEFVRLLQEKAMLDSKSVESTSFSLKETDVKSVEDIKDKYADKTDHLYIYEKKNTISIDNMVVKKEYRNQGVGQSILNDIIDYADRVQKTITLTPTSEFGTKERLKKWYKTNGFVENKGRKTDFTISDSMYRLPSDVSFSLKETNNISSKDRKELLDIIEHLKSEFETTKFAKADPKKLAKMTRDLLKEYGSYADYDNTLSSIDGLYQYIANGEEGHPAAWDEVYDRAYKIAKDIVENAIMVDDSFYQEYKPLRDYLRTTRIKFNKTYDSIPTSYEDFNDFRRQNFGRLKFTNDGSPIDTVYQELSAMYPEFFNVEKETNSQVQFERIIEVLDEIQPKELNPFEGQIKEASMHLANDIASRFFDVPQAKPTFADKAERRVTDARIAGAKKVEAVRQQKDAKIKKLIEAQREKTKKQLDKIRQQRDDRVKKEQQKRRDAISKMNETQKAKVLRAKIMRHASDLSKKLLNPTDNQHIPYELQGAVAKLLECINLESNYSYDAESHSYKKNDEGLPAKRTQAFNELKELYSEMASSVVVDPDLIGENGWLSDVISLADKRIADMTSSELDTVWQAVRAIEASISTANKIFADGKFATVLEFAEALQKDNAGKKEKAELKGLLGRIKNTMTLNMLTPETYLHFLGDAGDSIFRMMRDAQDKHISIMKEVADFTHKALKGVNVNSLEDTLHTVKLGGEDVQLSTAQLMELYVLMKREQAQDHILVGGILPDATKGKGVKLNTRSKPIRNIAISEISAATSKLTDEQKKIADKLQKYVSTVLSAYGNEASMRVYNYEKFLEKNYWTIRTNRQEIISEVGKDTSVTSVANKGMAKGTKPHANTSVRIGSIFDTFAAHSSDMATYAAWLGTSEDVNRIRNFVFWEDGARTGTVKDILDTVHGIHGSDYMQKLLTDIAIGVKGTDNMNPFDKLIGNYKAASVGANLRVVIQQPTAILRALDMIDARYIAEGAVKPLKGWEKAKKYAPIAQWKDWGHFDINTGRQMKDVLFDNASLLEKTKQVGMWGASMADSLAWGQLWNAVEAETKSKHKELEVGTEAYYETVAKRFTEIVDHTQVVDGILQRSQIMRSPDALTKMATSFMGEPTKQYNMAVAAAYDYKTSNGDARKKAASKLGRTAVSLAVAGIVNACAQSIIDAMRDDDKEKDYWEKWLEAFGVNALDTANPLNYIPFLKDIAAILSGYSVTRMDAAAFDKVHNAVVNMVKAVTGTSKYTIAEASAQLFAETAKLYGLPVANVKRDIKSLVTSVAIETDSYLMQYRIEKAMLNINYAGNSKNFMDILFNAYNNDRNAYDIIYKDMLKSGYDADKIKSGMESRMMKAEGVDKAADLKKRYMAPASEKKYDKSLKQIKASDAWKNANATQRKEAEADLYSFLTSTSKDMEKTRAEVKEFDIDETEYVLYQLAIGMADQPKGEEGSGSYDLKEKAEAISLLNLGDREIAYFFSKGLNDSAKEEVNDVLQAGIDMQDYVAFKAAASELKADKNAKGNSIPNSKKRKVVNYLNNANLTDEEWNYFYYEIMDYKK